MNEDIVVDITDIVKQQKESKANRFKLAVLIVGILIFCTLTVAALYNLPNTLFLVAIAAVILITAFTYTIPSRQEKKFLAPYVAEIDEDLRARGYKFADTSSKKGLNPWFNSASAYLYGDGLVLKKSLTKGLKMRQIKFILNNEKVLLTVERLVSQGATLIRVVPNDGHEMAHRKIAKPSTSGSAVPPKLVVPPTIPPRPPVTPAHGGGGAATAGEPATFVAWDKDSLT